MKQSAIEQAIKKCMKAKGWDEDRARRFIGQGVWTNNAEVAEFLSPGPGDVHVPAPSDDKKKTFEIQSVPVFKAGNHKGEEYTIEDLDAIVKNTNSLIKTKLFEPVIKLGHDENQAILQKDGWPAAGYVYNVYRSGNWIFADVKDVPKKVFECIENKAYKNISSEIYKDFQNPETKEDMGMVLRGFALLGADIPEVKGLGDILSLYHTENLTYATFSENEFKEAFKMKWTLDRVKNVYPCCVGEVKKFMEEKKITEIEKDDLAKIVSAVQTKKYDEGGDGTQEKKCPQGYKWDESTSRCMTANKDDQAKPEHQKVCPEGHVWDDTTNKCKPADVQQNAAKKKVAPKDLMAAFLKAAGKTVDETKPIEDQMPDEDEMTGLMEKMKAKKSDVVPPADGKMSSLNGEPETWKPEDIDGMKGEFEKDTNPDKTKAPDKANMATGWWDKCTAAVKDKTDTPDQLCGYIHQKKTGKTAVASDTSGDAEVKALKEQVKKLSAEKYKEAVERVMAGNKEILLPARRPAIEALVNYFTETDGKLIKFGEKKEDISVPDLFLKLIKDISADKKIVFGELSKNYKAEDKTMSEERKNAMVKKFAEVAEGKPVENVDLALLAEDISKAENVSYKAALKIAAERMKSKKEGE